MVNVLHSPMWYVNARIAMCSACWLRTGRINARLFGRASRNQPQCHPRWALRHCSYCWPGNVDLESRCLIKPTCNASLGGGHRAGIPRHGRPLLLCNLTASSLESWPQLVATPARRKQATQQHSSLTNKEIWSSPVISLGQIAAAA